MQTTYIHHGLPCLVEWVKYFQLQLALNLHIIFLAYGKSPILMQNLFGLPTKVL